MGWSLVTKVAFGRLSEAGRNVSKEDAKRPTRERENLVLCGAW
jgi:hypothetical protein